MSFRETMKAICFYSLLRTEVLQALQWVCLFFIICLIVVPYFLMGHRKYIKMCQLQYRLKVYVTTHLNYDILCSSSFASFTVFILCDNSIVLANKTGFACINFFPSGAPILLSVPLKFIPANLLFPKILHGDYMVYLTMILNGSQRDILLICCRCLL